MRWRGGSAAAGALRWSGRGEQAVATGRACEQEAVARVQPIEGPSHRHTLVADAARGGTGRGGGALGRSRWRRVATTHNHSPLW